jgi:FkbM family methyltransferase
MSASPVLLPRLVESCRKGRYFRASSVVRPQFWKRMQEGRWEKRTLKVFDSFIDAQTLVLDIGAWIGPTTLYAAPAAAGVICFEPDPVAYEELLANLHLNRDEDWARRVHPVNRAVGRTPGRLRIGSPEGLGQSVSSALYPDVAGSIEVDVMPLAELASDPRLDGHRLFIKIDIEGGEYDLLESPFPLLARPDTVLHLSLHPRILRRRERAASSAWPWAMLQRRLRFVKRHRDLLQRLPFRYYYTPEGRPLNCARELLQALIPGTFQREIVCTHQPWGGPDALANIERLIPAPSPFQEHAGCETGAPVRAA